MQNKRTLVFIISGTLIAALLLLFFFWPNRNNAEQDIEIVLSSRAPSLFSTLQVENELGSFTVTRSTSGSYFCKELGGLPISISALDEMANACCTLTANRSVNDWFANHADYGFDTPRAAATITYSDGTSLTLEIGDPSKDTGGYYLRLKGERQIYIASEESLRFFIGNVGAFMDLSLAPAAATQQITSSDLPLPSAIDFTNKHGSFSISALSAPMQDGYGNHFTHTLSSHNNTFIDPVSFSAFFGRAMQMSASSLYLANPSAADLEACNLGASAQNTLTIFYNDVSTHITIGNKIDNCYYVYKKGTPAIFLLPASLFTFEEANEYALITRFILAPMKKEIADITVLRTEDNTSYTLTFKKEVALLNGKRIETDSASSLYTLLCSLRAEYTLDELPSVNEVDVTLTFHYHNGEKKIVQLVRYGPNRHVIFINGEATYSVRSAFAEKLMSALAQVKDGLPINTTW